TGGGAEPILDETECCAVECGCAAWAARHGRDTEATMTPPCRTSRHAVLALAGFLAGLGVPPCAPAQPPPAGREVGAPAAPAGEAPCDPDGPVPITLGAALRLAQLANLDIAQAREVVAQAQAALLRAQAGVLPSIGLGTTYTKHEGQIQKTEGNII